MISQYDLIDDILDLALMSPDGPVKSLNMGGHMVAVKALRTGLASRFGPHGTKPGPIPPAPDSVHALAREMADPDVVGDRRSLAMAAVNSLLQEPVKAAKAKGQDLIMDRGKGKNVAVVGHFHFVEKMGPAFSRLDVLELNPRDGDLPADKAAEVLPAADVVAMTSTTILNGTMAGLLNLCRPDAFVMLLGPTTPFAPCLFEHGVDALAGSVVDDPETAVAAVNQGMPFKALTGVRSVCWLRR